MKKIIISLLIFFNLLHSFSNGQSCTIGSRKGLYVEIFGNVIINNDTYLTNLQNYIIKYDYNYILLYNLENKVFS